MIGANDLLIAAHARSLGAIVLTNNTKDFARVEGLKIENWMRRLTICRECRQCHRHEPLSATVPFLQ